MTRPAELGRENSPVPARSGLAIAELVVVCAQGHPRRRLDRISVGFHDGVPIAPMLGLPATATARLRLLSGCTCTRPPAGREGVRHDHVRWEPAACPCGRRPPALSLVAVVARLRDALDTGERRVVIGI